MKMFSMALQDGFQHIKELSDPQALKNMRSEGILIDEEGYYSFLFGEHKEFELAVEPLLEDNEDRPMYLISLYKNRVRIAEPLIVRGVEDGQ